MMVVRASLPSRQKRTLTPPSKAMLRPRREGYDRSVLSCWTNRAPQGDNTKGTFVNGPPCAYPIGQAKVWRLFPSSSCLSWRRLRACENRSSRRLGRSAFGVLKQAWRAFLCSEVRQINNNN